METLLLLLDALAMVIAAYMGLMDDRRPPGQAHTSLFRAVAETSTPEPSHLKQRRRAPGTRR